MADTDHDENTRRIEKEVQGTATYVGVARSQSASTGSAVWLIKRVVATGGVTEVTYASEKYDQIWDDRVSLFGAAPFVNSRSINFDGTNDYILIGDLAPFQKERTQPFSISLWFKAPSGTAERTIWGKQGASNNIGYRFVMDGGELRMHLSGGAAGNRIDVRTGTTYNDEVWRNAVMTYSGSSTAAGVKIYVNGSSVTLTVVANTLISTILNAVIAEIGARNVASNVYEGALDEVAFWSKELSAAEVTEIYNSGFPGDLAIHSAFATNCVGWWRMGDDDTFPIITDQSTNNNHGTMTNMIAADITSDVKF